MTGKSYDDKLFLDMPFSEALEQFAKTHVEEVRASVARAKKAKPSGGKINKPPDKAVVKSQKVIKLADKRKRNTMR